MHSHGFTASLPNPTFFPRISLSIPTFLLFFPHHRQSPRLRSYGPHFLRASRNTRIRISSGDQARGISAGSGRRVLRVQEAYETPLDTKRRALYERDMAWGNRLAFSAQRRCYNTQVTEDKRKWKNQWEAQLAEMKRRRMHKNAGGEGVMGRSST